MEWTVRIAAIVLALAASDVRAQPAAARRVVVDSFGGPRGGTTRAALVRSLEENGVVVVPDDEVEAARRDLGIDGRMSSEDYVALGRAVNASAFIDGRVSRRRRRWRVTVTVRSASDGERVGRESWGGRTAASLGGVRRNGYERLAEHLEQTRAPGAPQVAVNEGETPWYARAQDEERPPAMEPEPEPAPAPSSSQRYDSVRFSLNAGTLYRWMDTTVEVYAAQRGVGPSDPGTSLCGNPEMPSPGAVASACLLQDRAFRGPGIGHFELGGQAEIYPGAFGDQPFPYLGALISFSHSIAPAAVAPHRMNMGEVVSVPTSQLDFLVAARGRYRFGADRREPEIHVDAGWGMFNFDLGLAALKEIDPSYVIPPMQHGYVHLGAGVSYGIVPTYLTASLEFAYRIGTNIGADTRNVWGTETRPSNGLSLGLELKSEIPEIAPGAFVALRFSYFQFTTAFRGQVGCAEAGGCSDPMDPWEDARLWEVWPVTPPASGQPADIDDVVGGPQGDVNDNYVRLQLAVGYAFQ